MNKQEIDNRAKTRSNHQSPEFIIGSVTNKTLKSNCVYIFYHVCRMHATSHTVVNKQLNAVQLVSLFPPNSAAMRREIK